jgi:hypothetical protein
MTNVQNYTDEQLVARVKSHAQGYTKIPEGYWMIYVRSSENEFDKFDDKRYLMKGEKCLQVATCTTNAGKYGLKQFAEYNKLGCAVLKADHMVYDYGRKGLHKGKAKAWVQNKPWPYFRDNDKDELAEESGKVYMDVIGANLHTSSYIAGNKKITANIGAWSTACQVDDSTLKFEEAYKMTGDQKDLTVCILNEFEP